MAKQNINFGDHFEFIDSLKENQIPFQLINTTSTHTVIVNSEKLNFINPSKIEEFEDEEIYYFSTNGKLKMIELNLIKTVKQYCTELNKKVKVNRDHISYVKVNDFKNAIYKRDIWEIDLTAAYWNLAYKYKYISKDIYYKGLNLDENGNPIPPKYNKWGKVMNHISKMGRLIALGNLAKTFVNFYFDGKKYLEPKTERSYLTENYFFKVSLETDSIMKILSMLAGDNYLFYWVDAIYVKTKKTKDEICDYITNEIGMNFKVTEIFRLLKTKSYITVWDKTNLDQDENMIPRPYIFKETNNILLREVLDIDKNLIYKEHYEKFLK